MGAAQQRADVGLLHPTFVPARRRDPRTLVDDQLVRIVEYSKVNFRHVVTKCPEQFGDDDLGPVAMASVAGGIDFDEPHRAG